ncbi:hypothetical protein ACFQY4_17880 [Catellatospora bangladeshensis]|uniref:Uncharacterized protein n=1 Tax=Catellatospora bangladeshensis TaxID=310355 RepID=A0A8J3JK35_9ACTN|nr:hypothetical protein [Catellatospora bangladeshensis]GIF82111.1 hypothetical protein Cba03nite_34600 [Catellatospora bangladeshensis]
MLALIRRAAAARAARIAATTTYCEQCPEPVCTAACRAEAARTRGHEHAAAVGFRI